MAKPVAPTPSRPDFDTLSVQAVVRLGSERRWIQVGTASPMIDACGRRMLCIRLEAQPADHRIYLPLQDVLALASPAEAGEDVCAPAEHGGAIHICAAALA